MKTLILYAYCENQSGPTSCKNSKENLSFFLDNGLIDNSDYLFCINVNGKSSFNFKKYLENYENLKIFNGNGKCALEAFCNILDNLDINNYKCFYFITDKVRGPYNLNNIDKSWIDYYNSYLHNHKVIISSYGCTPWGKKYKMPYIAMKFMVITKEVLDLILLHNLFKNNYYDAKKFGSQNEKNPENIFEIKLSHFLLKNNINYVAVNIKGLTDLNILQNYNNKSNLLKIVDNFFPIRDDDMKDRIFWTSVTMKKIFN